MTSQLVRLKVGFVLDDGLDKPDGVQQYILTLGRWMESQGHEVHYLVGETKRQDLRNVHSLSRNVSAKFNQNRMSIPLSASINVIKRLIDDEKFDILHVQMPYSPLLAGKIIKSAPASTAIVGTFHIIPYSRFQHQASKLLSAWVRNGLNRFDQFISVSSAAQQFAKEAFRIDSIVLPNVINRQNFSAKHKTINQDGKLVIVFLGRLVPRKGCIQLIQAVYILNTKTDLSQKVRLVIAGDGVLAPKLRQYVIEHGLQKIIEFRGFITEDDKPELLASADIAVFPSLGGESFGIVLLEAMAAGAGVVIGGNNVGYRTVLGGWADCLVDPSDTSDFANKLERLINDAYLRNNLHQQQQQAIGQYDVEHVGPELLAIYESAIAKRRKAQA